MTTKNVQEFIGGSEVNQIFSVKDNLLARAHYTYTLSERRVMETLLALGIDSDLSSSSELVEATIFTKDHIELWGLDDSNGYKEVKGAASTLINKVITIRNDEQVVHKLTLLSESKYVDKSGALRVTFNPKIGPYIHDLKAFYTKTFVVHVRHFSSIKTWAFYEFLNSFAYKSTVEFSIEEVRKVLDTPEGYNASQFKRRILNVAISEVNKTNIRVVVKELKKEKGKRITHLQFDIRKMEQQSSLSELDIELDNNYPSYKERYNKFISKEFSMVMFRTFIDYRLDRGWAIGQVTLEKVIESIIEEAKYFKVSPNKIMDTLIMSGGKAPIRKYLAPYFDKEPPEKNSSKPKVVGRDIDREYKGYVGHSEHWDEILNFLLNNKTLDEAQVKNWLSPLQVRAKAKELILLSPSNFNYDWVNEKLLSTLEKASITMGKEVSIKLDKSFIDQGELDM